MINPVFLLPVFLLLQSGWLHSSANSVTVNNQERVFPNQENEWWLAGREQLENRVNLQPRLQQAKNIILFVGDGMSVTTVTAARIFDGQSRGNPGENNSLSFERFPYLALVKTYTTDSQVPDSAGTASAMNSGIKTRNGVINVLADQSKRDCYGPNKDFPLTLAAHAERLGMATGVVTTTRVTHATPAAVYGHSPSRNWERDADMPKWARQSGCLDLAQQLISFPEGNGLDVIMGGGRDNFLPERQGGKRLDSKNLSKEWLSGGEALGVQRHYTDNLSAFRSAQHKPGQLLGLFASSHMAYEADRDDTQEPSLAEMTERAIDRLADNDKGYYLMVEGGRIDHAHHATNAYRALHDTQALASAVDSALKKVDLNETLILVTADHSHVFTMAGYPARGNPILGLVLKSGSSSGESKPSLAADGKPYTTLGYINGPNAHRMTDNVLVESQVFKQDYIQQSAVPLSSETHGGDDVALYAIGPQAHLVGGVIEQHTIFHIMAHALGWRFE